MKEKETYVFDLYLICSIPTQKYFPVFPISLLLYESCMKITPALDLPMPCMERVKSYNAVQSSPPQDKRAACHETEPTAYD